MFLDCADGETDHLSNTLPIPSCDALRAMSETKKLSKAIDYEKSGRKIE